MCSRQRVLADGVGRDSAHPSTQEAFKVRLPFGDEVGGTHHECPPDKAQPLHLAQVEPTHDRLSRTWLVGEQETKERLRQHRAVDGAVLVRIGPKRCGRQSSGGCSLRGASHPLGPQTGQYIGRCCRPVFRQRNDRRRL
jgi:hypothetical protein